MYGNSCIFMKVTAWKDVLKDKRIYKTFYAINMSERLKCATIIF